MRLQLTAWSEVEQYLKRSHGIILPIGATEQHGPTGLMGTDAICAETIAWEAGRLAHAMVGPTLTVGMSEHHMQFPGTITLRPSTLVGLVRDVVLSLGRHGFRRMLFVNGHGGNTASLEAGFFEAYTDAPRFLPYGHELRCLAVEWWRLPEAERLAAELFGDRDGDHASASEVSVAAAAFPEHLKDIAMAAEPSPSSHVFGPADFRRRYPDGRMGSHPELASVEAGRRITDAVAAEVAGIYRELMDEL